MPAIRSQLQPGVAVAMAVTAEEARVEEPAWMAVTLELGTALGTAAAVALAAAVAAEVAAALYFAMAAGAEMAPRLAGAAGGQRTGLFLLSACSSSIRYLSPYLS